MEFDSHTFRMNIHCFPHFTDGETEAYKVSGTCSNHIGHMVELGLPLETH